MKALVLKLQQIQLVLHRAQAYCWQIRLYWELIQEFLIRFYFEDHS